MIDKDKAEQLAKDWIAAWNAHDIDAIMHHYADDIEFNSLLIVRILGDASGQVNGKDNLRAYFIKGLAAYPELHFELKSLHYSPQSVAIHYIGATNNVVIEVLVLNEEGKVKQVFVHY